MSLIELATKIQLKLSFKKKASYPKILQQPQDTQSQKL